MHALEVLINKEILALHNCPEMLIGGLYQRWLAGERVVGLYKHVVRVAGQWSSLLYSNRIHTLV